LLPVERWLLAWVLDVGVVDLLMSRGILVFVMIDPHVGEPLKAGKLVRGMFPQDRWHFSFNPYNTAKPYIIYT